MFRKLSGVIAGAIAVVAAAGVGTASLLLFYQPQAPKELRK